MQKAAENIILKRMGTPQEVADAVVFLAQRCRVLHHRPDPEREWGALFLMTIAAKTLLIISGGIEAVDAAKRAKEMGHTVVVSDRDPQAPGFAFADSCLIADVYGATETAAAAERYNRKIRKIDGVICVAADAPGHRRHRGAAPAPARPAGACGGTGLRQAGDEEMLSSRPAWRCPGSPKSRTPQELQRIAIERGRDLVIKPVDQPRLAAACSAWRKVEDLTAAFMLARSHSPTERVMVEQYLSGPQVSTESIVIGGRCFTPGFSDRNYEYLERYAPFFIENGGDLPSHLPAGDPGQGARSGGAGRQRHGHHRRHRQGRHRGA